MRGVVLGNVDKPVDSNNVATLSDTKISQSHWNDLESLPRSPWIISDPNPALSSSNPDDQPGKQSERNP
jgi:hypothetical protein